jgi:glutathione synthase/RimK-type ligase-like ATP-grasp enzyme
MLFPRNVEFGLQFLRLAYRTEKYWKLTRSTEKTSDMTSYIPFYKQLWKDAAHSLHAEFDEITNGFWRIRRGDSSTLINNHIVQIDDPVTLQIAGDKPLCHRLLANAGLPVPSHATYTLADTHRAVDFMTQHSGSSFVIKPALGTSGGRGVTLHVRSIRKCRAASALASLYSHELLIERFVPGECYRLLFLNREMIHAVRQRGFWIRGDGQSTIRQLVNREYVGINGAIDHDADFLATMKAQHVNGDFVPKSGQSLLARSYSVRNGGSAPARTLYDEDAVRLICREIQTEARRAVEILGSRFATVELVTTDPTRSLKKTGGAIIEINTTPGLHRHSLNGSNNDSSLAAQVLRFLLQHCSSSTERTDHGEG